MKYQIRHTTRYNYDQPVSLCYNKTHLMPRNTDHQRCLERAISVLPVPTYGVSHVDYFGNSTYHFSLETPHKSLEIETISVVEVNDEERAPNMDIGISCAEAKQLVLTSLDEESLLAREFLIDSPMIMASNELLEYALPSFQDDRPLLTAVRELTTRIFQDFTYDPAFTTVATPLTEVLEHRRGVCQDFAHLAIGCLRALGYPARYVSGYLETLPPPGQVKLVGTDASHAWFAVYSPTEGWFDFDPTNDTLAAGQHITTAWGRDYSDVAPLKGVIFDGGKSQTLEVSVDVSRV